MQIVHYLKKSYLAKRFIHSLVVILGVSLITFFMICLAPGDPTTFLANPQVSPEDLLRIKENLGLTKPVYIQYFIWLREALKGNLGHSLLTGKPVLWAIAERVPATLVLMASSLILTLIITIPLGVISALKKNTSLDHAITIFSFIMMSLPSFWLALMLIYFFSLKAQWFPAGGMYDLRATQQNIFQSFFQLIRYLALPVLSLTLGSLAGLIRYQRASFLNVLKMPFVKAAYARGLSEKVILWKHVLKNSLLPLITILGMSLPALFGGAVITEKIFAWPGMGRLGMDAIFSRDYPLIMGMVMFFSVLIIFGNFIADAVYSKIDPRIEQK